MRTNIVIDDALIRAAQQATGLKTKKAVVEEGLRRIVRLNRQKEALNALWGAADWEGDIRELRKNRDIGQW